ncbi:ABC transporter, molybdate-binding protein [mine drainage metagenome]|uniref:ABC transporter, molybdate-binding protein n=1 Tax=mine drainage metagenome TaxID=410659 RepID=T0Z682_9ZZZZ
MLPGLGAAFANETPGVQAPAAAQTFEGSIALLKSIGALEVHYDVAAVADYRLIPNLLEPHGAAWELVFASDPMVLVYNPSVAAFAGLNTTNWAARLQSPGVLLGVANASIDPLGYAQIFALELAESAGSGVANASSLYRHFYSGAPGSLATPDPATTRIAPEADAAALVESGTVSAFLIYRSYALSTHLSYVALPWTVDMGSTNQTALARYATATTQIEGSAGLQRVTGSPILFAVTVPTSAPDPALGQLFVAYLLSPSTRTVLSHAGFTPIFPAWADHTSALPAVLGALAAPLPGPLAAGIG